MGKNTRGIKELSREQKLINENKQLKKELANLRKKLSRLDIEGLEAAKQILFDSEEKDRLTQDLGEPGSNIEALKKEWQCHQNGCIGFLEITVFNKINDMWYYRRCNECDNRTKAQKYTPDVKGLIKKTS